MGQIKDIVYVDMDDTICEFTKHKNEHLAKNPAIQFPQAVYKFFETIPPIENAIESVLKLNEIYDVWILTRPSVLNPLCYTEKRVWIEKYLGMEFCQKLILSPDKSLLKGQYLIDDVNWNFDGELILFGSEKFKNWDMVLKYML